jgi:hypothetical protein
VCLGLLVARVLSEDVAATLIALVLLAVSAGLYPLLRRPPPAA